MGLDPGTNRAGLHTAREVISGRQISYPVPYILVILCVLCLACLIVAAHSADATQTIALVLACSAFVTAIAILVFAVVFRPELLRSERHEQTMRLIDIVGDPEMDQADRAKLGTALLKGRSGTSLGEHHE
jgi:hypothetical protein